MSEIPGAVTSGVLYKYIFRYNGHFLNLAPRFRAIEPPDRPGLSLRLVVRLNHPICDQNEPKNVHYLPVVTPRMILQDAPDNDFQVLGPFARSHQTHPTDRIYDLSIFKMRRFARLSLQMGVTV